MANSFVREAVVFAELWPGVAADADQHKGRIGDALAHMLIAFLTTPPAPEQEH